MFLIWPTRFLFVQIDFYLEPDNLKLFRSIKCVVEEYIETKEQSGAKFHKACYEIMFFELFSLRPQ